ncbi:hypothetical protein F5Y06DRAFT_300491 [Hypoxylon sp. FL0890]|nr:hypothetical protein F5Y06DRAFT_300491 [Hypoxylon sp. FL0890]
MASHLKLLALTSLLIQNFRSVVAGSIAAWLTELGPPQIIMQDDATGKIFYSLCNSNGSTPIFPASTSASFEFDPIYAPRNGTSLAGTGWVEDDVNVAAMWFQREDGQLVFHLWKCNATGQFNLYDFFSRRTIGSNQSVHPRTGIMAVNLGPIPGYRVYYQDESKEISILAYTPATSTWDTQDKVSRDAIEGFPISAGFIDANRVTVVTPRDESNIEISKQQQDGTWVIATLPTPLKEIRNLTGGGDEFTIVVLSEPTNDTNPTDFKLDTNATVDWSLEAWDGGAGGIGLTMDDDSTRNIYYIGNDSMLHCLTEMPDGTWQKSPRQDERTWPPADVPNAQFATASDFRGNEVFIYYVSNGQIAQLHQSAKYKWDAANPLPKYNNTVVGESDSDKGLSVGTKAGIGVGVSVGCLALILLAAYASIRRKRRRGDEKQNESQVEPVTSAENKSPPPQLIYYEMPAQEYSHEAPSYHGVQEMPIEEHTSEIRIDRGREERTSTSHNGPAEATS